MLVVLQAMSGGAPGRRVQLRTDQVLKVGSSGWADFSVPGDKSLLDLHFEVRCAPEGCTVRGLNHDSPTLVNGEAVATAVVYDGDEISAGDTKFTLTIQGGPARPAAAEPTPEPAENGASDAAVGVATAATAAAAGLVGLCAYLDFGDDIKPLAESLESAEDLIGELTVQEKFQDALRLRAYLLEKRQAVWWGCHCMREELDESLPVAQEAAIAAAANWVEHPDEPHRRVAEEKAAETQYSGPGSILALGAFWSDGSLAPEGSPDVEPDERLTSQGVTAALVTAAYLGDATKAPDRFRVFLERGKDIADGKIALPGGADGAE